MTEKAAVRKRTRPDGGPQTRSKTRRDEEELFSCNCDRCDGSDPNKRKRGRGAKRLPKGHAYIPISLFYSSKDGEVHVCFSTTKTELMECLFCLQEGDHWTFDCPTSKSAAGPSNPASAGADNPSK